MVSSTSKWIDAHSSASRGYCSPSVSRHIFALPSSSCSVSHNLGLWFCFLDHSHSLIHGSSCSWSLGDGYGCAYSLSSPHRSNRDCSPSRSPRSDGGCLTGGGARHLLCFPGWGLNLQVLSTTVLLWTLLLIVLIQKIVRKNIHTWTLLKLSHGLGRLTIFLLLRLRLRRTVVSLPLPTAFPSANPPRTSLQMI